MLSNLNPSWQNFLSEELEKDNFLNLVQEVDEEYQNYICFPPKDLIFSAFNHCAFEDVKVVIIGQDPYHGEGEANGLSFSVNDGVKIPPSLRNIFRELTDDLGAIFMPTSGNLEAWAKQGVLLLNATLSVRKDSPNSHKHLAWSRFTDAVIEKLASEKQQLVFLLWGSFAQKKKLLIDAGKHYIIEAPHPSPLSAYRGFFGSKPFSKINKILEENNAEIIRW